MQQKFGKYEILKKIGSGGMAEVYLARSIGSRGFEKMIVIKKIHSFFVENQEFLSMFIDEARLAAKLNHGNIAQVFDFGEMGGNYYIAMEYIDGVDLRSIFRKTYQQGTLLPLDHVVRIFVEISKALEYAHNKRDFSDKPLNIVHRDISPDNILVSYEGVVKLVDFGIAKATTTFSQTVTGTFKGKFSYMSPEQINGEPLDNRSDLFSLAIILYEFVAGVNLFNANNPALIMDAIRKAPIRRPSEFNPNIPAELEGIIMRGLTRDTTQRYQSAAEMQRDLEWVLHNKLFHAYSTGLSQYLRELFKEQLEENASALYHHTSLDEQDGSQENRAEIGSGVGGNGSSSPEIIGGPEVEMTPTPDISSSSFSDDYNAKTEPGLALPHLKEPGVKIESEPWGNEQDFVNSLGRKKLMGRLTILISLILIIGGGFFYFTRSEKGDEKRTEPEIVIPMSGEETVPRIAPIVKKEEKSSSEVAVKSVPAFSSVKPRKMKIKRPAVSRSFIPTPVKKRERKQFFPKPAKEPEKKVEFSIVPKIINLGQVQIVSNSGTAIYIDGKLSGKGKYEASEMEIGLHRVRLINRNLNKTHSFTFNLKKGQTYIKEHNFRGDTGDSKPSAKKKVQHGNFGTITIKSTPQSLVYISGRMSGKTPIIVRRLPAGNYSIRLINRELNITRSFIAVIKKGEHLVKEVRLK